MLDQNSKNEAYNLGRLFAVLENLQRRSAKNPLNSTIRDRYFSGASSTPATVFPVLLRLASNHFSSAKIKDSKDGGNFLERQILEIMDKLGSEFPATLNVTQQGSFFLGYYQQRQKEYRSEKKNSTENEKGTENEQVH